MSELSREDAEKVVDMLIKISWLRFDKKESLNEKDIMDFLKGFMVELLLSIDQSYVRIDDE